MRNFRKYEVWQDSIGLVKKVYEYTADFPKNEIFGLVSQMRRAAVSIAS
ncbi:MAG: four helix bundle protein, partial [Ignavibacteriales bacterium]|nr:four helix bundle protein [Ignavibacteriales bacterium]